MLQKIQNIKIKLERLLTGYLDQDIEKEIYRSEKGKLLLQKKSLEEEMTSLSHKQNDWLEPFQNWVKVAQELDKIAFDTDLFAKKVVAKEIFGSNLLLGEKTVRTALGGATQHSLNSLAKTGETVWALLRNAHSLSSSKPFSSFKVLSPGIEPRSSVPQTDVLSIELREQVAKQYHNSLFFSITIFSNKKQPFVVIF